MAAVREHESAASRPAWAERLRDFFASPPAFTESAKLRSTLERMVAVRMVLVILLLAGSSWSILSGAKPVDEMWFIFGTLA
ncbi:MAG: hypothetical protein KDD44_07395, partial [Bdellovibrionales bacterium]|nr:hypothetical protein [Bdellovibrionales bacterium]